MITETSPTVFTYSIQLTADEAKVLQHISETDHVPLDVLVRKFLLDGLDDYRIEFACRGYAKGRLNLSGAARIANINIEEMMNHLDRRGIEWRPTFEQHLDGLANLAELFNNDILRQVVKEERAKYNAGDPDSSSSPSV
ncbi:MAG: UPF0175 family protein [Chloroflexi bacterium]|nr:UPF0175 family protein [Chloroflexota bacterium]MBI5348724.1 UPF0175 family protein [Chloroflexota bacterium]